MGDLNNNGLDVVTFAIDGIKVWDHKGQLIQPISSNPIPNIASATTPILADVDNNHNDVEIIVGNNSNKIYAYKIDGFPVIGFPLRGYGGGLCVADIDGLGKNEVVGSTACGQIGVWKTNGIPSKIEWGSDRHDQYNTGEYQTICNPMINTSVTTWNSSQSMCGDLIIKSGTLTINNSSIITMGSSSMINVMSGASLIIDSASILNANVKAMAGSNVIIKNNGSIKLRSNGEFNTELNAIVDIPNGSISQ